MDRKLAYITLQKCLAERFPPGPVLNAWNEWLDAVYAGDTRRPPPQIGAQAPRAKTAVPASVTVLVPKKPRRK